MGFAMRTISMLEEWEAGVRCAVRFPIHLPIRVIASGEEFHAESENFSSNGVLFRLDRAIRAGTAVEFLVQIPGGIIGMQQAAAIHCIGRIVRTFVENDACYAAAVIDEYRFQ